MQLSLQDIRELITGSGAPASTCSQPQGQLAIVIADRGHVWVGRMTNEGNQVVVRGGAAVRIWGTTRGLGQLAEEGPLSGTKLDPVKEVRVSLRAVIATIPCKEASWNGKLC